MTEQKIIEGNKIIAEFMGAKISASKITFTTFPTTQEKFDEVVFGTHDPLSLKYHSSWDWLMPVVDKIESLGYKMELCKTTCYLSAHDKEENFDYVVFKLNGDNRLDAAFTTIVHFAEWYNPKPNNHEVGNG